MSANAYWNVRGFDQNGALVGVYLSSPDLSNPREARKRAAKEAKRRWLKKGLKVRVTTINCVG